MWICTLSNYVIRRNVFCIWFVINLSLPKRLVQPVFKFVKNILYEMLKQPVSDVVKISEHVCERYESVLYDGQNVLCSPFIFQLK